MVTIQLWLIIVGQDYGDSVQYWFIYPFFAILAGCLAEPNPNCRLAQSLVDNFEDDCSDSRWGANSDELTTIGEASGQLIITLPANATEGVAEYTTVDSYSLTSSYFAVEVPTMVNTNTNAEAYLQAIDDSENFLSIEQIRGLLYLGATVNGVRSATTLDYDPEVHRWWRLREEDGRWYAETSVDGSAWEIYHSDDSPGFVDDLRLTLGSGIYEEESAPGSSHFDNLNGGRVSSACLN